MDIYWEDGYTVRVRVQDGTATITANREGLRSLAKQLLALAQETPGSHIHYDRYNALEDGADELIVELTG